VSRKTFGPKWEEVTADWRKQQNDFHYMESYNIIYVTKSTRMRWARLVERREQERVAYEVWVENTQGKRPLGNVGVDGNIILKNF
jgi:hypothetical protein